MKSNLIRMHAHSRAVNGWLVALLALLLPLSSQAAHLEFVQEVPGMILDVNWQRILYAVDEGGRTRLKTVNRVNGAVQTVPGPEPLGGWLTARGVLFATLDEIYEWRPGAAAPQVLEGYWNGGDDLQISKDSRRYGAWPVSRPQGHYRMLRDFVRGTNVLLGNGNVLNVGSDVADNGDAVYMQGALALQRLPLPKRPGHAVDCLDRVLEPGRADRRHQRGLSEVCVEQPLPDRHIFR